MWEWGRGVIYRVASGCTADWDSGRRGNWRALQAAKEAWKERAA